MLQMTYDKKVHLAKWDIDVVPYLNLETIENIINDLITCNNGLERDMRLIADILVACTDLYNGEEEVHYTYEDILYSGTIGAASEGVLCGKKAIAFSTCRNKFEHIEDEFLIISFLESK